MHLPQLYEGRESQKEKNKKKGPALGCERPPPLATPTTCSCCPDGSYSLTCSCSLHWKGSSGSQRWERESCSPSPSCTLTFSTNGCKCQQANEQMAVSTSAFGSLRDILIQKWKSYMSVTLRNCFYTACQKKKITVKSFQTLHSKHEDAFMRLINPSLQCCKFVYLEFFWKHITFSKVHIVLVFFGMRALQHAMAKSNKVEVLMGNIEKQLLLCERTPHTTTATVWLLPAMVIPWTPEKEWLKARGQWKAVLLFFQLWLWIYFISPQVRKPINQPTMTMLSKATCVLTYRV